MRRMKKTLTTLLATACLTGCATKTGEVNVAVVSVQPWKDLVVPLSPKYGLDAKGALELVNPTTQYEKHERKVTYASDVNIGIAQVKGKGEAAGAEVPEVSGSIEHVTGDLGRDPFLTHGSATALFQEVALLERYLRGAAMKAGYAPYLVRMHVAVEPHKRKADWDAYVDIEFGDDCEVVPLLATQNLEASQHSSTKAYLLAMARGVQFLSPYVGVDAKSKRTLDELEARLGNDLNGVLLVSRKAPGVLAVRVGARLGGEYENSQAPQVHSVSALVLVPIANATKPRQLEKLACRKDGTDCDSTAIDVKELSITPKYTFRRANSGGKIGEEMTASAMTVGLPPYTRANVPYCGFKEGFTKGKRNYRCTLPETLTIVDDGKSSSITVPGIHDANAEEISAVLELKKGDDIYSVRSKSVSVDEDRRLVTFKFPSLGSAKTCAIVESGGKKEKKCEPLPSEGAALVVYHRGIEWWEHGAEPEAERRGSWPLHVPNLLVLNVKEDKPKPKPVLTARAEADVIYRRPDGTGQLVIGFIDGRKPVKPPKKQPSLEDIVLEIEGAEISKVPAGLVLDAGRLKVTGTGRVTLPLSNLSDDHDVVVRIKEKKSGKDRATLRFTVDQDPIIRK